MRRFTLPVLFALLLTVISPPIHAEKVHGVQAIALAVNLTNGSCVVSAQVDGVLYTTGLGDSNSNESASGNILFQCRADLTSAAPKKGLAIDSDGQAFACVSGNHVVFTDDWRLVITPSGNLIYNCHAH